MKKTFLFLILNSTLCLFNSFSQPTIQWQKCLGGSNQDGANSIQQTVDGGYIVAGVTSSNDGDVTGNHGGDDFWIVKLDGSGNIQWQKCLGGSGGDYAYSIQKTSDSGYIIAGSTGSNNGDVTGNHGSVDYWVVKLDGVGNLQWQKCFGGTNDDTGSWIQQTNDAGYIIAGFTESVDGDVNGNHGNFDYWVVKLDASGTLQWQKCLGGTGNDFARFIRQTSDGGYTVVGSTNSNDGDVTGNHGIVDYWIAKLDSLGTLQWQKCLGGTNDDDGYSIQQLIDGGFIVAGYAESNDGDVSGNHGINDYWIVKLDSTGTLQWQKCYGGAGNDLAWYIQQATDGGYLVAGFAQSNDGDVTGNHGGRDFWILKLDGSGMLQWEKSLGGTGSDEAGSVQQTTDGGFIIAGWTNSTNGDVTSNHGDWDYWVVKLSPLSGFEEEINHAILNISPNPFTTQTTITFSKQVSQKIFIGIFDINGRLVSTLADKIFETGEYKVEWNTEEMDPGIYFLQFQSAEIFQTAKLVVTK